MPDQHNNNRQSTVQKIAHSTAAFSLVHCNDSHSWLTVTYMIQIQSRSALEYIQLYFLTNNLIESSKQHWNKVCHLHSKIPPTPPPKVMCQVILSVNVSLLIVSDVFLFSQKSQMCCDGEIPTTACPANE